MKKFLSVFLAFITCLSLCACTSNSEDIGASNNSKYLASVHINTGDTVFMKPQELIDEFDANGARFAKLYRGATIEFVGTVKSIKTETDVYNGEGWTTKQNMIIFEEGWILIIGAKNTNVDLAEYYPGQKLQVTTGILGPTPSEASFITAAMGLGRTVWLVGNDALYGRKLNTQITNIRIV